jgi:hypothetical protein
MWQISPLNLDSTKNLVTCWFPPLLWVAHAYHYAVRADWHLSYDHGDWAFVPAEHILRKILKYKANTFVKVCPDPYDNLLCPVLT